MLRLDLPGAKFEKTRVFAKEIAGFLRRFLNWSEIKENEQEWIAMRILEAADGIGSDKWIRGTRWEDLIVETATYVIEDLVPHQAKQIRDRWLADMRKQAIRSKGSEHLK